MLTIISHNSVIDSCVVHETCRLICRFIRLQELVIACLLIKHVYLWGHCTFYDLLRWIAMIDF